MKRGKADAELKGKFNGRSNNSFNRSGMSLPFIRKIEGFSQILPARLIRALGFY
jgi:hypothetical protein